MAGTGKQEPAMLRIPTDEEESALESAVVGAEGRSLLPRLARRQLLLAALGLACALALAAAVLGRGPRAVRAAPGAKMEAFIKAFGQCGGNTWTNSTCCKKGCACIIQTKYYSGCKPPGGAEDCDLSLAADEVEAATEGVDEKKPLVQEAQAEVKKAQQMAQDANAAATKAEGSDDLREKKARGAKMHAAMIATAHASKVAKGKAKGAHDVMVDQEKAFNVTKAKVDEIAENEKKAAAGSCAAKFGKCRGNDIPPAKACCQLGCVCQWKSEWYSECRAPKGKWDCDPQGVKDEAAHLNKTAAEQKKKLDALTERSHKMAQASKEMEQKAADTKAAAIKAGTEKTKAINHAQHMRKVSDDAQRDLKVAHEKLEKARHSVNYAKAAVATWKKVAKGDSCSKANAEEVAAGSITV